MLDDAPDIEPEQDDYRALLVLIEADGMMTSDEWGMRMFGSPISRDRMGKRGKKRLLATHYRGNRLIRLGWATIESRSGVVVYIVTREGAMEARRRIVARLRAEVSV